MSTRTVKLQFPGDASFTDVSHLVVDGSMSEFRRMMNDKRRSVVDTYSFRLKHDQDITDAFANATDKIWCTVDDGATREFTGWIAPTDSFTIDQRVGPRSVEALDMSYLLDEPISASVQYPALVTDPGFKILDKADAPNSIVHQLLTLAGYDPAVYIDSGCPNITTSVDSVTAEEGAETYRDILDDLLSEYGYVLYWTAGGKFSVHQWDHDTVTVSETISSFGTARGLQISKVETENDGAEVTWAELDVMQDALLYRDNLPISSTAGSVEFTGEPIGAGDYYPPDSDIEDQYQRFRTRWLDLPYLRRETRLQNQDLSLVNTSGHAIAFTADAGVAISTQVFEPNRARVNFRNSAGSTESIYTFEITGDALYRSSVRTTTVPVASTNPEKYTSRFIFSDAHATRLSTARSRMLRFGNYHYDFELRHKVEPGAIVELYQERDNLTPIQTTVIILERRKNPQRPMWTYRAQAITAYSSEAALKVGIGAPNTAAQDALTEAQIGVTPTFDDLDNGYTASTGGTTTPTQPVLAGVGLYLGTRIAWDRQINLTNLSHYEILVSPDGGTTWYEPVDGGTGLGTQDPGDWTAALHWPAEMFVHADLPLGGTAEDPTPSAWTYKVRRVTKQNDVSAASSTITVNASPVANGTLAKDAISTNLLNAVIANIADRLTISSGTGFTSTALTTTGGETRGYLDLDEVAVQKYTTTIPGWGTLARLTVENPTAIDGTGVLELNEGSLVPVNTTDARLRATGKSLTLQSWDGTSAWVDQIKLGSVDAAGDARSQLSGRVYAGEIRLDSTLYGIGSNYGFIGSQLAMHVLENAYYDGSWKRIANRRAALIQTQAESDVAIKALIAESGAADSTITWINQFAVRRFQGNYDSTVVDVGVNGRLIDIDNGSSVRNMHIATNLYHDGTAWRYVASAGGALMNMTPDGSIGFYTVPSGTAGATASPTARITIAQNGDLTAPNGRVFGAVFN
jgi:hypothetical protein